MNILCMVIISTLERIGAHIYKLTFVSCYHKNKVKGVGEGPVVGSPWQARRAVKWSQQAAALGVAGLWWDRLEGPTRLTRSVNRLGRGPK